MNIILITHFHKIDLSYVDTISFQPLKSLIILDFRDEEVTIHFDNKADCFRFMKRILQTIYASSDQDNELLEIDLKDIWAFFECYETAHLIKSTNGLTHKK